MTRPLRLPWLAPGEPFPPVEQALPEPNGLLAAGGDLSIDTLLRAYASGIFPWFSDGPVLWWAPDPRTVFHTDRIHVSRRFRRRLRRDDYHVSTDRCFERVMQACARPRAGQREDGAWINATMIQAYLDLHRHGMAHSIEVWVGDDLVGGLYGVRLHSMFFAESMFTTAHEGSKIALVHLAGQLRRLGVPLFDAQVENDHLLRMGAQNMPREQFQQHCRALVRRPLPRPWSLDYRYSSDAPVADP